jgi:hypothetical protein
MSTKTIEKIIIEYLRSKEIINDKTIANLFKNIIK